MSFCQLHWFSKVLARQRTTWVLLPDDLPNNPRGPFPTLYLLHGLSDDHTIWTRRTRIDSYASGKPLIVVMPDGGRGFYTDHENGPKHPQGSDHDLLELARRAKVAGSLPRIRIDCGTEDFLLEDNREVHRAFDWMSIPHEYEEFPGAHNWDYWDVHVREAIGFHMQQIVE